MSSAQAGQRHAAHTVENETSTLDAAIAATGKNQTLTDRAAMSMGVPADSLLTILRGVWTTSKDEPDLTQSEMFVGIGIVAKYDLDPIAREIYVTKSKGKMMTVIGIDGWIKILDRTSHYDGFDIDIHEDASGNVDYVDATIHSKVRSHPATYRAFASEYAKISGFMAGKIKTHMLRIFALRHAARLFVPLGGTVMMQEEADFIERDGAATTRKSRVETVDINATDDDVTPTPEEATEPTQADLDAEFQAGQDADNQTQGEPNGR